MYFLFESIMGDFHCIVCAIFLFKTSRKVLIMSSSLISLDDLGCYCKISI